MKTLKTVLQQLVDFKTSKKFLENKELYYPGLADPALEEPLTNQINQAADDFLKVARSDNPTEEAYLKKIELGLARFQKDLDDEERERIGMYYEELMDIVGFESTGEKLKEFISGVDSAS